MAKEKIYNETAEAVIYKTNDYSKFKFFEENREIYHAANLENDILNNNKLIYHPITITQDYEIIDGQHRFKICEKHKLPVYYMIDHEYKSIDMATVQSAKPWGMNDWIHYYTLRRVSPYEFVENCLKNNEINPTVFMQIFIRLDHRASIKSIIKEGSLKLKYPQLFIIEILEKFHEICKIVKNISGLKYLPASFQNSVLQVLILEEIEYSRLIKQCEKYPERLISALNLRKIPLIKEYIIRNLYNHNHSNKIKTTEYLECLTF